MRAARIITAISHFAGIDVAAPHDRDCDRGARRSPATAASVGPAPDSSARERL